MNAFPSPFDIVTRLRDYRSHRIYMRYPDRDGTLPERVDWNLTGTEPNTLMVEAAAEIERLRAERDEARREVSFLRPSVCLGAQTAHEYADARGWDCFDQDNWPSTKDRSEPDAESQSPEA